MGFNIGEKIRMKRHQMGMTLKELAGDRVTPAQISAVEKSKCKASIKLMQYIAEKLEVDVEYFTLTDEEWLRKKFENVRATADKLISENNYENAIEMLDEFKGSIENLLDNQRGYYYKTLGDFEYSKSHFINAFEFYVNSVTYYLKTKNLRDITYVYNRIGNCLFNTEKSNAALGYYLAACHYSEKSEDEVLKANALYNTALCYFTLKKYNTAEEYLDKCMRFIDGIGLPGKEKLKAGINMIRGSIKMELEESSNILNIFKVAFDGYSSENDILGMGRAKNNQALCLWHCGKIDEAIACFNDAINYKITVKDETLVDTYLNLSELYKELHNMDAAMEILGNAEEKILEYNFQKGAVKVFMKKFEYLCEIGDYDKAEIAAFIALDYIQKSGDMRDKIHLYIELSEMYKKTGDEVLSIEYAVNAKTLMV